MIVYRFLKIINIHSIIVGIVAVFGFGNDTSADDGARSENRCYPYYHCSWVYMVTNLEPECVKNKKKKTVVCPQRIFRAWQSLELEFAVDLGPKGHAPANCSVEVKQYQDWFKHCKLVLKELNDGGLVYVWEPNGLIMTTKKEKWLESRTSLTEDRSIGFLAKIDFKKDGEFIEPGLYKIILECNRDRVANELDGEPEDWAPGHGKLVRESGGIIQIVEPKTNRELAEEQVMMVRSLDLELEEELAHFRKADSLYPGNKYILLGIYRTLEKLGREEEAKESLKRCREVYPACGRLTL
jgi:tetratricopeptide (TPR) repeat protein